MTAYEKAAKDIILAETIRERVASLNQALAEARVQGLVVDAYVLETGDVMRGSGPVIKVKVSKTL